MGSADLLTRDAYREGVFARDRNMCVACRYNARLISECGDPTRGGHVKPAIDAHHIIERRLWGNGGYYLDNGASLCERHHLQAEATLISCDALREMCGITRVLVPEHLYQDHYDKWGNPLLDNGQRLRGELFYDESVQKILPAHVLALFTQHVKYPRTYHLPWSPGCTDDDRKHPDTSMFEGRRVVVTEKMDGENTTMYRDYVHARSLEYSPHESRNLVKALHAQIAHEIPEGWRICGENLVAKHAIHYQDLEAFFCVFSIWNEQNVCLSWEDTVTYASVLGLAVVPCLHFAQNEVALWDEKAIRQRWATLSTKHEDEHEGYVVRLADEFSYRDFRGSVAKYVRANHVLETVHHWKSQPVVQNVWRRGDS